MFLPVFDKGKFVAGDANNGIIHGALTGQLSTNAHFFHDVAKAVYCSVVRKVGAAGKFFDFVTVDDEFFIVGFFDGPRILDGRVGKRNDRDRLRRVNYFWGTGRSARLSLRARIYVALRRRASSRLLASLVRYGRAPYPRLPSSSKIPRNCIPSIPQPVAIDVAF